MATRTEGLSQMRSSHTPTAIETAFDEVDLVANTGLPAPGVSSQKRGVAGPIDAHLHLPTDAVGRTSGDTKAMMVIGTRLAGGDSINPTPGSNNRLSEFPKKHVPPSLKHSDALHHPRGVPPRHQPAATGPIGVSRVR